jgi:hypothetical protein
MMADDDTELLNAAVTIRSELTVLVPTDAEALGATLDESIAQAHAVPAEERTAIIDDIVGLLIRHRPTRDRLQQLAPVLDTDRGVPEGLWALDQVLAGPGVDDDQMIEITCGACKYVNKLAFRPPADDPGDCQNPDKPRHDLKMA